MPIQSTSTRSQENIIVRVLKATLTLPARATFYAAAVGALALAYGTNLPPVLAALAGGVGYNALASIIERLARDEELSDDQICELVQSALADNELADEIRHHETQEAIARVLRRVTSLQFATEQEHSEVLMRLVQQSEQYPLLATQLKAIMERLDELATKEQAAAILVEVREIGERMGKTASPEVAAVVESYLRWVSETVDSFSIPSLNLKLPIFKAWVRLHAIDSKDNTTQAKTLAEYIREYHEWHRLADTRQNDETFEIEIAAKRETRLVVVGGPGSGKSTLLRRLAHSLSLQGRLVLRVSLRAISLRMAQGETFDEAIIAVASDSFTGDTAAVQRALRQAEYLLADGLDETDPNRSQIADQLNHWAVGDQNRHVVVTTRPVGHNPSWFPDWKHVELLPLGHEDVKQCAETIFALLHSDEPQRGQGAAVRFLAELQNSQTAAIAARNPQLLGFLIALSVADRDITGNRYRLLDGIVNIGRTQASADRRWRHDHDVAEPIARRALECIGWTLLNESGILERDILRKLSDLLEKEADLVPLKSKALAEAAVDFWEERGLLERLSVGVQATITFVHMSLQDYAAASFFAGLPTQDCAEWIRDKCAIPQFREAILLIGGTERARLVVEMLLKMDDCSDPISTVALFAADVLSEAENRPADLVQKVVNQLSPRLTSSVPSVVYETGEQLQSLASISPGMIGPIAVELQKSTQRWTREVGCALGLLASSEHYVDDTVLAEVLQSASDSQMRPGRGSGLMFIHRPLIRELLIRGAERLLRADNPCDYVELIKTKYKQGDYSSGAHEALGTILAQRIGLIQVMELDRDRYKIRDAWSATTRWESDYTRGLITFLKAILLASQGLSDSVVRDVNPQRDSIARLYRMLEIDEFPAVELAQMGANGLNDALIEVMKGAMLVAALDPAQVQADTHQTLDDLQEMQTGMSIQDALRTGSFPNLRFRELISGSEEGRYRAKLDWTLARGDALRPDLLIQALTNPAAYICWFAGELLLECCDREVVRTGLKSVLAQGSGHTVALLAQIVDELWPDEAYLLILDRLENNLTNDCAPLIKILPRTCGSAMKERAKDRLVAILKLKNPVMIEAALQAIEGLGLDEVLAVEIKDSYEWWLNEGLQDPVGGGAIPPNAAAALLAHLVARGRVSIDGMCKAATSRRSDVRKIAIESCCQSLAADRSLIPPVLAEVRRGRLPIGIIDQLSTCFPGVCRSQQDLFIDLLGSAEEGVRIAAIRALGDGWADRNDVEPLLAALLEAPETELRDEAVLALRSLHRAPAVEFAYG